MPEAHSFLTFCPGMARGGGQVPGRGAQASHSLLQVRTHSHPPPPTPLHHIPAASTELILWGRPGVDRATVLPSRHGLLPGLRSGPQPDSRLLFPFAQRNPLPQGSSQRRCAAWELHLNKPKKKDKCLISVNLSLARSVTGNFPNMCWPVYHHCSLYKKTSFIRISFR